MMFVQLEYMMLNSGFEMFLNWILVLVLKKSKYTW